MSDRTERQLQVTLTPQSKRAVLKLAELQGVSANELIREALIDYLDRHEVKTDLEGVKWGGERARLIDQKK